MRTEAPGGSGRQNALAVVAAPPGYPQALPPEAAGGGFDLAGLLRTLLRRSPIIFAMALLGFGLGIALQAKITPRYSSSAELLLEPKRSHTFGTDTQFGNFFVDTTQISSLVAVIESSDMLGRVVATAHLDEIPEFGDPVLSRLHRWFGFLPFIKAQEVRNDPAARQERALDRLQKAVSVTRVGVTYVLNIEARASRPEIAQRVASAVTDVFLDDQVERNTSTKDRDRQWLTRRLSEVRRDLMQSEESLDAARKKAGLIDLGAGATTDRQTMLTGLNTQLTQAQADVANARGRLEQAERARANGADLEALPEATTSTTIAGLRTAQQELAQKLGALRGVYNENFPDIRHIKDSQQVVQSQLAAAVARIVESRRSEYEAAVAKERALSDRLQAAAANDGGAAGDEGHEQVRDAQRLVDANRGLYDALVTRWREAQQQETREEPEARIISQATLAGAPSWPKPLILPAAGGFVMLVLGLGLTLVPVLLDSKFSSVTAVEQRLGMPVLGAIPMLRRRDLAIARRRRSIVEYASRRPLSRFSESLRMLRAHLRISADGGSNVIQVTSAIPGEGKSTVAATLAVTAASAGIRTVLIDADVRTSSVSAMFGIRNEEGLSDVLELGVPVASVLRDHEDLPLAILGAGSSPTPLPDLVSSRRFTNLLRDLAESHSLVILDSPPVLPVSDALVLSKHADATIMVVQWRSTPKAVAEQAIKALRKVGAPLAGVMLNKIDLSKISQYESGYAQYGWSDGKAN